MEVLKKTAALRVQRQVEGKALDEVTQLSLSGVPVLPELWAPYANLTHLYLISMKPRLTTMDAIGLDRLHALRVVDVSDNNVSIPVAPPPLSSLRRLTMPNNKIALLEEVRRLAISYPQLTVLDVADNDVDTPDNFTSIFEAFAYLEVLNSRTRDGVEVMLRDSDESDDSNGDDDEEEESEESEDEAEEVEEEDEEEDEEDASSTEAEPPTKKTRSA